MLAIFTNLSRLDIFFTSALMAASGSMHLAIKAAYESQWPESSVYEDYCQVSFVKEIVSPNNATPGMCTITLQCKQAVKRMTLCYAMYVKRQLS